MQINLLRHQHTELPASKYKKKRPLWKPKQTNYKHQGDDSYKLQAQQKKKSDTKGAHNDRNRCSKCCDTVHLEGFKCPAKKYQCKTCHKFGHFTSMCYQKKHAYSKPRRPKAHQLQAGTMYTCNSASYDHLDDNSTADDSFCLQVKIKCNQTNEQRVPRPTHLITNLAYTLPLHHHRNLYLRARLDIYADVNLMPVSMYQLIFSDPNMKKLAPSKLQVGTYMTDIVKIVGSCTFHLVHPDTKRLLETMNDRNVLLSCKTTLLLGLIQPGSRLDYLPPRASLITSSADHPKKTRAVLHVQKQEVSAQKNKQKEATQTPAATKQGPKLINKLRDYTARISRCLSRSWQIPGSRLPYTD